jgi:DNA helicase-2/ATP-dependent DNA helicase PcrA
LYTEYEAQCQREGVARFCRAAAALVRTVADGTSPCAGTIRQRFRHILVDEFQDTNRLQYAWLKLLAGRGSVRPGNARPACLFAVGDDDQSIYAFRGAEIGNMRDLQREFELPSVIRLEQNYRSHGNILDAANALIKQNVGRLGKNLWTEAGAGEPIRVFEGLFRLR